jgi:cytochrome c550
MKRNPLIPFAITAVVGILLIISLSFYALNDTKEEAGGGEQTELAPEDVFAGNCASCHGGDLSGGFGPNLQQIGSTMTADEIATIIKEGRGDMPAQKQVAPEATQKLADWLAEKK